MDVNSKRNFPIGANYEGGKIITYALNSGKCIAHVNAQIGMDAPFHGEIANEAVRTKGRSETQFKDYSDEKLQNQLFDIFNHIIKNYKFADLIIQIARGRSAITTEMEILNPVMCKLEFSKYQVYSGYRKKEYFPYPENDFVFVNIGMFSRITHNDKIKPGDICNPTETYDIL